MSNLYDATKYDEVLASILVNEKSILGFLSSIFSFLARRTDFYYVPEGPYENMGFPPGVAEELVIKVLRTCDPKTRKAPNGARKPTDVNNEIMCSTVAHEVEVVANEDLVGQEGISESPSKASATEPVNDILASGVDSVALSNIEISPKDNSKSVAISSQKDTFKNITNMPIEKDTRTTRADRSSGKTTSLIPDDYEPPVIPTQKNSETYNGAERENYSWSQTILELDITVKLPPDIKSSKDLKVTINSGDVCIAHRNGDTIIKDSLPYKIKAIDSFWSISEGKLLMHLEKVSERWWNKFLTSEEPIDLSKIDCSRPMDELPEDQVAKIRELQWNEERKLQGLPTSDEIRNVAVLRRAWNAPGSPFQGKEFDPNILANSSITSFPGHQ